MYTTSSAVIDGFVRTVYCWQKPFFRWGLQYPNLERYLWFLYNRELRSTQTSTLVIFWFQLLKRWKTFQRSKFPLPPSHTLIKTQDWCKRHFSRFWSKVMWPPLHRFIWIQWMFWCGLCWKQLLVLI